MKITRTTDIQPAVANRPDARPKGQVQKGDDGPTKATLSKDGSFVESIRSEAAAGSDVRADKVADAKALLASGSLESSVDLSGMLDSLMGDL